MAKTKTEQHREQLKRKIVSVVAKNFMQHGYTETTIKMITAECGISTGSFNNLYQTKEDVLCELVVSVLNQQFGAAEELVKSRADDLAVKEDGGLFLYAAETTLQLYIVELNENLRDVYSAAYSLPKPSAIIQKIVTGKLEQVFRPYLPDYQTKDFFKLEIATGGIMRGFMTIPCDMWFTMDQKVQSFLECTFKLYDIPQQKIQAAIAFVKGFDFNALARRTVDGIFTQLEE